MRIPTTLFAAVLCAAGLGMAQAQTSNVAPTGGSKIPAGISFAYDEAHGHLTTTGVQLATVTNQQHLNVFSGTITVTININVVSNFGPHTRIGCSANAIGGLIDLAQGGIQGGIETANGRAKMTGPGTAVCTLTIPYTWTISQSNTAVEGVIIGFAAAARNEEGDVIRSTTQADGILSLPSNGASTSYTFGVSL